MLQVPVLWKGQASIYRIWSPFRPSHKAITASIDWFSEGSGHESLVEDWNLALPAEEISMSAQPRLQPHPLISATASTCSPAPPASEVSTTPLHIVFTLVRPPAFSPWSWELLLLFPASWLWLSGILSVCSLFILTQLPPEQYSQSDTSSELARFHEECIPLNKSLANYYLKVWYLTQGNLSSAPKVSWYYWHTFQLFVLRRAAPQLKSPIPPRSDKPIWAPVLTIKTVWKVCAGSFGLCFRVLSIHALCTVCSIQLKI